MADRDSKDSCKNCKFFVESDRMGVCHRFPEAINKHMNNWCGEFLATQATKVVDTLVETLTKPIEVTFAEPAKKAGRPKKVIK